MVHQWHLRVIRRLRLWLLKMLELALGHLGLWLRQQWCLLQVRSHLAQPRGAAHPWHLRVSGRLRQWLLKMLELVLELAQVHLGQMLRQHLSLLWVRSRPAWPSGAEPQGYPWSSRTLSWWLQLPPMRPCGAKHQCHPRVSWRPRLLQLLMLLPLARPRGAECQLHPCVSWRLHQLPSKMQLLVLVHLGLMLWLQSPLQVRSCPAGPSGAKHQWRRICWPCPQVRLSRAEHLLGPRVFRILRLQLWKLQLLLLALVHLGQMFQPSSSLQVRHRPAWPSGAEHLRCPWWSRGISQ